MTVRLEWFGIVKVDMVAAVVVGVSREIEKRCGRKCHTSCCSLGNIDEYRSTLVGNSLWDWFGSQN